MVLLRCLPLLAVSALPVSMSAALNTPPSLNIFAPSDTMIITNSSLKAPSGHVANLTYAPWPSMPYTVKLHPRFSFPDLIINYAHTFRGRWPISVRRLQDFLGEFRDNLASEYPVPGLVPRVARQSTIDVESYTVWTIEINESILGNRLPTEFAVCALDETARELGKHGPASFFFNVRDGRRLLCYGLLTIEQIGSGDFLNRSLSNGKSHFQTSQTNIL